MAFGARSRGLTPRQFLGAILTAVLLCAVAHAAFGQSQTFTAADGSTIVYTPPPAVVAPPPVVTPPPASTAFVVYANGVMNWQGVYVSPAPPATYSFTDISGKPPVGTQDLVMTPNGGDFPVLDLYSNNSPSNNFAQSWSTAGYTSLTFMVKESAVVPVTLQFILAHDESGNLPILTLGPQYCTGTVGTLWVTCTVSLTAAGVFNTNIYKFGLQLGQKASKTALYVAAVGFQ